MLNGYSSVVEKDPLFFSIFLYNRRTTQLSVVTSSPFFSWCCEDTFLGFFSWSLLCTFALLKYHSRGLTVTEIRIYVWSQITENKAGGH